MDTITDLRERVVRVVENSSELQRKLKTESISWNTIFVRIQKILLDAPPQPFEKSTMGGVRLLGEHGYKEVLRKWMKEKIGGHEELFGLCDGRFWHPPENSLLYTLDRVEQEGSVPKSTKVYFLLITRKKCYFLKKHSGKENYLNVIQEGSTDRSFTEMLNNFLSRNE